MRMDPAALASPQPNTLEAKPSKERSEHNRVFGPYGVLKIGVWARHHMENDTQFGSEMLRRFFDYEIRRAKRRREK